MNKPNTMPARGFEPLHLNDMGQGCIVLWQQSVSGERDALVLDVSQLEQALAYLRALHGPTYFLPRPAND